MICYFGKTRTEGGADQKPLLGGKGANLAEMTSIGLPVPPGFTITTEVCDRYYQSGAKLPAGLMDEVGQNIATLERETGKKFGDEHAPLLLSVRSGAAVSMPGMMNTILNLGLNDETVEWAYPAYRNTETGILLWLTPRLIVGVKPTLGQKEIVEKLPPGLRIVEALAQARHYLIELIDPRSDDPIEAAARLQEDDWWVELAEPNFIQDWQRTLTPNHPLPPDQWHLQNTGQGGGTSGADARLQDA